MVGRNISHLYYGHSHTRMYKQEHILKPLCYLAFSHLSPGAASVAVLCPGSVLVLDQIVEQSMQKREKPAKQTKN